jgi:hypothetical protein
VFTLASGTKASLSAAIVAVNLLWWRSIIAPLLPICFDSVWMSFGQKADSSQFSNHSSRFTVTEAQQSNKAFVGFNCHVRQQLRRSPR